MVLGGIIIIYFFQWETWGTESLKNLANFSQLVTKFKIQSQASEFQKTYSCLVFYVDE